MIAHPRYFVRFLDGREGNKMYVGFLPGSLGAYIQTLETKVAIGRIYALKLLKRRIQYEGFKEIQHTIDRGTCMVEDPYHLSFLYVKDRVKPEIYFLLIKTNARRNELWLVTFHRLQVAQFRKRLKPACIIRHHADDAQDADE